MHDDRLKLSRRVLLGAVAASALITPFSSMAAPIMAMRFALVSGGRPMDILIDEKTDPAIEHVAQSFAADLERVSGTRPQLMRGHAEGVRGPLVIIAAKGQSAIVERMVAAGKLSIQDLDGQWEAFRRIVVSNPFPGVPQALVIVGSDRRGAVFGTYDLSERMGVSPWHWFADVPVARRRDLTLALPTALDRPKVRYRGFFINDEDPCLSGWAAKKFGGVNSAMYAHVFELLLRMKGNYLWPAMWGKAFALDDPKSMVLADAMGVVMGNSHHEPMLRAQAEWHRGKEGGITGGPWDYSRNAENLRAFWRGGIERMMSKGDGKGYESVVTVGMRGDGDEAMAAGTATELLERIVHDQRAIIANVTKRPASEQPQVWALYKEVQEYYDKGMKVPDDVTLMFSDDNWGQIRRLPKLGAPPRKGGQGIYYHFDYVGVPRNYKWINTNQIEKIWQQMDLAYRRDARAMWMINVGDIKPMEYPLGFIMAMAWDPEAMTPSALAAYPRRWAEATFGPQQADAIGELITSYSKYTARRKPELIDQNSFPLGGIRPDGLDGGEFGDYVAQWDALEERMMAARARLEPEQLDAYYQLLEFPIAAMANLYRMYYGAAWNTLLASRNDPRANYFAHQVETAFKRDSDLTARYHTINNGKWDGMMAQVHMSYVIWNDPTQQTMPSVSRVGADTPSDRLHARPAFVAPAMPDDVVTLEAVDFTRANHGKGLRWTPIADLGHGKGAVVALPQGQAPTEQSDGVSLDYDILVKRAGPAQLTLYLAPTLDTSGGPGDRIGVSLDDGPMQVLQAHLEATGGAQDTPTKKLWARSVCDNMMRLTTQIGPVAAGRHRLRVWRLDDNMVLQKIKLESVTS
ncbi:MAG: glycosyl hydrolase 115 family protein [Sphingomonadales bacterium]|nr:glycosyl hydrolase 115 family protein [Sphingomonadales bacterium]MDE2170623.1 glycosyl hydrolase 115 family protein [Sphingomonadales bacterium]